MVCQPPDSGQKWRCGTAAPGFACRPGAGEAGGQGPRHTGVSLGVCVVQAAGAPRSNTAAPSFTEPQRQMAPPSALHTACPGDRGPFPGRWHPSLSEEAEEPDSSGFCTNVLAGH